MKDLTGKADGAGPPTGILPAAEWNELAAEAKALQTLTGLTPSSGDLQQLAKAIAQAAAQWDWYDCTGSANACVLTPTGRPGAVGYLRGTRVRFIPNIANTGASTVNVNGLGVKNILREDATNLVAGDLATTRVAEAYYDGTQFRLTNASLGAPAQALPHRFIAGMHIMPTAANRTTRIDIAAGSCRDATNSRNLVLSAPLTKRFDTTLAIGSGQGGFPSTEITAATSTWYRVFLVGHSDGRVEAGFDTHATAQNLVNALTTIDGAPGWLFYRQLGWVRSQAGSATAFVPFVQYAAEPEVTHWLKTDVRIDANGALVTSRTARSLALVCPPGALAHVQVLIENNSGSGPDNRYGFLSDKNQDDYTPDATNHNIATETSPGASGNSWSGVVELRVQVDASSEIYERWSAAGSLSRTLLVPRFSWAR